MASLHQARILLADDFAPWRHRLRSLLGKRPEWNIVGEASDGQEAIEKATAIQPDIILLDVGMPCMNGIEAAKVIHQRCPKSKILFVTQNGNGEIKNAAIGIGAAGYVLKTKAGNELLDAITNALDQTAVSSEKLR